MLGSTIQRELASIIMRELNDPRLTGLPSITRVKVSSDLSVADVYVTVMGSEGHQNAALNALRHSAGMMRAKLTKSLTLRQAPYLKFHLDENLKKELEVLDLLDKVAQENAEIDRKRAEQQEQQGQHEQGQQDETE
jgi:ribosome-binding factor A